MKNTIKTGALAITLTVGGAMTAGASVTLYANDFTAADGAFDGSTTATGAYAGGTTLTSLGQAQSISGNQLQFVETSSISRGVYFDDGAGGEFNWATSSLASYITAGGSILITFDLTISDVADNNAYAEFSFGTSATVADDKRYDDATVDFGFRFEGDRIDQKDNNASAGTIPFTTNMVNNVASSGSILLEFTSFDAGSNVDITMSIAGNTFTNAFTWDTNDDFRFSMGVAGFLDEDTVKLDNLVITTPVPEPTAALLGGLGLLGLLRRRRA